MTDRTEEEILAEQFNQPGQLDEESKAWWAAFIEHWAARGADRKALNEAVVRFRRAQAELGHAMRK